MARRVGTIFLLSFCFLSSFVRANGTTQDDHAQLEGYENNISYFDDIPLPDSAWMSENQPLIDESIQAIHAADRALKSDKVSIDRLLQVAQDCDHPSRWQRESEKSDVPAEGTVAAGEAEVYRSSRTPYIVKISKSTCSGDRTEVSYYFYRKDKSLAYLYTSVDTFEMVDGQANPEKPVHLERHTYYHKSGKQLASYEKMTDGRSGQTVSDPGSTRDLQPAEYVKAKNLPFYGLL